jgi:hypothetical protein
MKFAAIIVVILFPERYSAYTGRIRKNKYICWEDESNDVFCLFYDKNENKHRCIPLYRNFPFSYPAIQIKSAKARKFLIINLYLAGYAKQEKKTVMVIGSVVAGGHVISICDEIAGDRWG